MKKSFDVSLFFGCCVISIGVMAAGWLISKELPDATHVPSSLAVTTTDTAYGQFGEYLSRYEVAAYLGITDEDVTALVESFIKTGELDNISTEIGANRVFIKSKLDEWMENRVR
ncbi:MAG: helix-turn-helix domain-containing protein [Lachnospiraceae bacterium]|nr:helix-turn-helix domain-containing protein [Lachnospiraceae bacterium]